MLKSFFNTLIGTAALCALSSSLSAQTITLEAGTLWNAGSEWWANQQFTSQSGNPNAPFQNQSVFYRGWNQGGSIATLNGANRVFRERLSFSAPVSINSVQLSGVAFNGPNCLFRLLDANSNQVAVKATEGGNSYRSFTMNTGGVTGSVFYLEEYDTSSDWRYRDKIAVNYSGNATLIVSALDAPTYPALTSLWAYVPFAAESANPLAVFSGNAVSFRGYNQGGSQEQLGVGYLIYRYRLDYGTPVRFDSFVLDGFAFHSPDSLIRVLDTNRNVVGTTVTGGDNGIENLTLKHYQVNGNNTLSPTYYVEEYDRSSDWRFRDNFRFNATIGVIVSGAIFLQSAANSAQSIDFTFRPTTGSAFTRTATLDASGTYSLANIPFGNYTVAIKGAKWLRKNITVNARVGNVLNANATLLAGDANNDNFADISDLLLLISAYNKVAPNAGFSDAADFNCDGSNDIADLLLLVANYNKQGDL